MKRLMFAGLVLGLLPSLAWAGHGHSGGFVSFGYGGGYHGGSSFALSIGFGGGYGGYARPYYGGGYYRNTYYRPYYGRPYYGGYARPYYRPYYRPVYYAPPVYYAAPAYYDAPVYCPPARRYSYDDCDYYYAPRSSVSFSYRYYR
jgi:hypothetical protein